MLGWAVMHIYFIGQKGISANVVEDIAEIRAEALAKQASKNGHTVTVAVTTGSIVNTSVDAPYIRTRFFPSLDPRIPGGYLYALLSCIAALWIRPDTIVVQGWNAALILRILSPFLPHTCAILIVEDLPVRFLCSFIASGFEQVCSTSRTIQYMFVTAYNLKTTYIPDGYTPMQLPDIATKQFGLQQGKYAVLFAQDIKEIRRVARTFAAAKTRKKLVVFGTGKSSPKITYIDIHPTSRTAISLVHQAGVVIAADPLYSPLLLHAMDAGKQIIATADSLHEELLGVTARYYLHRDYKHLTELVKTAFKQPAANTAARLRATHHFTWDKIGQEYERVYKHSRAIPVPFDSVVPKESFKIAG